MQTVVLEEAETKIRQIVKDGFIKRLSPKEIGKSVDKAISEALKTVKVPDLRAAAIRSLRQFAQAQYDVWVLALGRDLTAFAAVLTLNDPDSQPRAKFEARKELLRRGYNTADLHGVPLKRFAAEYIKKQVTPVLDRLTAQYPLDPDDARGRNSLRNRAEMEVRYNDHLEQIERLREGGNRLVIASAHADCSERCRPWQGRVYSLDGSRGVTDDGRVYVPLEEATDIFYTTKAGKVYKNGLLGFNCRHYLVPYRTGYAFPKPNPAEEQRAYAITMKQRAMEREVRKWRTEAVTAKGADRERYLEARRKAIEWNKRYIEYSRQNRRAYYPSRTEII